MGANDFVETRMIDHIAIKRKLTDQFVGLAGLMPSNPTREKPTQSTAGRQAMRDVQSTAQGAA